MPVPFWSTVTLLLPSISKNNVLSPVSVWSISKTLLLPIILISAKCSPLLFKCVWFKLRVFEAPVISINALWFRFCVISTSFELPSISIPIMLLLFVCVIVNSILSPVNWPAAVKSGPMTKLSSPSCVMFNWMPVPLWLI